MYARASCEYQTRNGFTATNAAARTPAQREKSSRALTKAIGTSAIPASVDSDRSPTSPLPNTWAHAQISTKYNGGVVSTCATVPSIPPKLEWVSYAVRASSIQKLWLLITNSRISAARAVSPISAQVSAGISLTLTQPSRGASVPSCGARYSEVLNAEA